MTHNFCIFIPRCHAWQLWHHKPLVPLLGNTNLDSLPPRVLRFCIHLMRFDYSISHVPGKFLYTVDALSRAPILSPEGTYLEEAAQTELFVQAVVSHLPADSDRLHQYRAAQKKDNTFYILQKGMAKQESAQGRPLAVLVSERLSLHEDLLLRESRIVVPQSLQQETLQKIHNGHQGIQRCLSRVASSVWWPGIPRQVEQLVKNCPISYRLSPERRRDKEETKGK